MELKQLTVAQIRKVAVEADTDPRTVQRVVRGQPTRGMTGARIMRVLQRLGLVIEKPERRAVRK